MRMASASSATVPMCQPPEAEDGDVLARAAERARGKAARTGGGRLGDDLLSERTHRGGPRRRLLQEIPSRGSVGHGDLRLPRCYREEARRDTLLSNGGNGRSARGVAPLDGLELEGAHAATLDRRAGHGHLLAGEAGDLVLHREGPRAEQDEDATVFGQEAGTDTAPECRRSRIPRARRRKRPG